MRKSLKLVGVLVTLMLLIPLIIILVARWIPDNTAANPLQNLFEPAAPLVAPVTKEIFADRDWQNMGILLETGQTIRFQFLSGEIRDREAVIRGPSGVGWACAERDCCEPMPDVERDALIGRVGDYHFSIEDRSEITVSAGGELQLRINDCDAGLFDNSGSFQVRISP